MERKFELYPGNPEIAGCMTGMTDGIFAGGNGSDSANTAVFTDVVYEVQNEV